MYSKSTHKTVKAVYAAPERVFCVPKDWNLDDVEVLFDDFYYKGVKQDVPSVLQESEMKIAYDVTEDMDDDLIAWFDCGRRRRRRRINQSIQSHIFLIPKQKLN